MINLYDFLDSNELELRAGYSGDGWYIMVIYFGNSCKILAQCRRVDTINNGLNILIKQLIESNQITVDGRTIQVPDNLCL